MKAIPVPVINHILCVPMQFHFLCHVMRGEKSRRHTGGHIKEHRQEGAVM